MDEAAFIRNFDELWMGLYSTLSTGGRAIVLSTPNGVGDKYHELCTGAENGENEFNFIKLLWDVHPERDTSWFELETKNMSRKQIAQELMCDFAASGDTFLSSRPLLIKLQSDQAEACLCIQRLAPTSLCQRCGTQNSLPHHLAIRQPK